MEQAFNNSTSSSLNATLRLTPQPGQWMFLSIFSLAVLVLALLTNGTVLGLFFRAPSLVTPFNIYLINLLTANLLTMLVQVPNYLVNSLHGSWFTGSRTCSLYIFGFVFQAGMINAHALITINRLWAVLWPIHYRRNHTRRTAIVLCIITWIYISAFKLAVLIPDALYYRRPELIYGCSLNRLVQMPLLTAHQIVVYDLPGALMIVAYPFICYKQWRRKRAVNPKSRREAVQIVGQALNASQGQRRNPSTVAIKLTNRSTQMASHTVSQGQASSGTGSNSRQVPAPRIRRRSNGFLLLTLVTLSMIVVWLPTLVYYTVIMFVTINSWPTLEQGVLVMLFLEAVVDPLLFTMAVTDLRNEFKKLFSRY
ncbi:hypothetical protein BV898_18719 [Hypsibius exemplaris]|uniref:G-protein coupled receptors family 1 profile domain-containing protein n=1 Tax=Hypsibius exemplaris TaxID=2072580 RepID=A0A9X6NPK5_HYPEX|nr:hypothetical protein BV898_18719 [Hypsibius exemplaris]